MSKTEWIALIAALWAWDRYNRSHSGMSAIDSATQNELGNFAAAEGTNFTNSVWDPYSGQPGYQFGAIYAPGGAGLTAADYTGAFGHM